MTALIDITGLRYGRLLVVKRDRPEGSKRAAKWVCLCDCGTRTSVRGSSLRSGRTVSCGCYGRETGTANTTHGDLKHYKMTPEYVAWRAMLARCYNPGNDAFPWYGAKGIAVCKKWRSDFAAFLADMGRKPAPHLVLGRIEKEGDYEPSNCEWTERGEAEKPPKRQRKKWMHRTESKRARRTSSSGKSP